MTAKDFTNATVTNGGYPAKDVQFNRMFNAYTGKILSPMPFDGAEGATWHCATWDKRGKCRNRTRPDCDLVQPTGQS
jgi:hypothetical protein